MTVSEIIEYFEQITDSLSISSLRYDPLILSEIVKRYNMDEKRILNAHPQIDGLDHFKSAGILTYWISKLKPVKISTPSIWCLDEILALFLGLAIIFKYENRSKVLSETFVNDFLYTLRYRNISQEILSLLYHSMMKL